MHSPRKAKLASLHSIYSNENGIILAVSLMFLTILGVIGSAAYVISKTDIKITGNYKAETKVFVSSGSGG